MPPLPINTLPITVITEIGNHALPALNQYIQKNLATHQFIILADTQTAAFCWPVLSQTIADLKSAPLLIFPDGEAHKTLETCQSLWHQLLQKSVSRQTIALLLGGGVVGDLGGFVAATYKRGLNYVQIPTSLLAMVDASVGGKLGIDFEGVKNAVGLFGQPQGIYIDPVFLKTLPKRHLFNGYAEMLKHALIANQNYWQMLVQPKFLEATTENPEEWTQLIQLSVAIKQQIVSADPYENHQRRVLNFGHTAGHALESAALTQLPPNSLLHGEAVAVGMAIALKLSVQLAGLNQTVANNAITALRQLYPNAFSVARQLIEQNINDVMAWMYNDKKNDSAGIERTENINMVLLQKIAQPVIMKAKLPDIRTAMTELLLQ